jgi:ribosomal protein L33
MKHKKTDTPNEVLLTDTSRISKLPTGTIKLYKCSICGNEKSDTKNKMSSGDPHKGCGGRFYQSKVVDEKTIERMVQRRLAKYCKRCQAYFDIRSTHCKYCFRSLIEEPPDDVKLVPALRCPDCWAVYNPKLKKKWCDRETEPKPGKKKKCGGFLRMGSLITYKQTINI